MKSPNKKRLLNTSQQSLSKSSNLISELTDSVDLSIFDDENTKACIKERLAKSKFLYYTQ